MSDLSLLEKAIGYTFQNRNLLVNALTHSSYANEARTQSNERLEFLGDSVLSIVVSEHLYTLYRKKQEGSLTRMRASLVCEDTLFRFAQQINLGEHLRFGKGEKLNGGCTRPSILADGFEALIAAIYLDGGIENAREFIMRFIVDEINRMKPQSTTDYKTKLQEIVQAAGEDHIEYCIVGESGPDHDKRFTVEVHLNSNVVGKGTGHSKKEAEQRAAREALKWLGY